MKKHLIVAALLACAVFQTTLCNKAAAFKKQNTTGSKYTTAAKSKLADELCECAVAARITGTLAIPLNDVGTQKQAAARTHEFLTVAKEFMSSQYVEAKFKSMLMQFMTPGKLNDTYANQFILERVHMCGYIVQNKIERLNYWNDLITRQ